MENAALTALARSCGEELLEYVVAQGKAKAVLNGSKDAPTKTVAKECIVLLIDVVKTIRMTLPARLKSEGKNTKVLS